MNDKLKTGDQVADKVTGAIGSIMGGGNPLKFQIPEVQEVEVYAVRTEAGNLEFRTKDQLAVIPPAPEEKTEGEETP